MAYKFQLGAARLGGSLVQEGNITAESSQVTASLVTASAIHVPDAALHLNGTAVTATAAELNYLDGADSNINTLVLPASTTISDYAKGFLNDTDEATFKATVNLEIGVDVQAWDQGLQYLAGLNITNQATFQEQVGLEIGVDVQAYDAELAAIAGLTSAANKGIQFTGNGTAATYDLTTFAKTILDDADAPAARTTLGLGSIATQNSGAVNIDGGAIDGTEIGGAVQAFGKFTSVSASQGLTGSLQYEIQSGEGIKQFNFRNGSDVVVQLTSSIAGSGLAYSSGVLSVDLSELTEEVVNVGADSFIFIDADGSVTRRETLADYATAIAGQGLISESGVLAVSTSNGIQVLSDTVQVKLSGSTLFVDSAGLKVASSGITNTELAGNIAADKLQKSTSFWSNAGVLSLSSSVAGAALNLTGGVLDVQTDGSSIEISADKLQVKAGGITNAMLSGSILFSKLESLPQAKILIGDSSGVAQAKSVSGDVTIDKDGLVSIGAGKVTNTMLSGGITNAKLVNSTISNKALGTNLDSLTTAGSNSGITMSSYNGSAAVSDLAINLASSNALVLTNGLDLKTQISGDRQFTGTVTINNLNVTGTLTTVNTTELEVKDKNILIASGSADAATAAGAGITVGGAGVQWKYAVNGLGAAAASGDVWMASGSAGLIDIQAETFYGNLVGAASMPVYSSSGNANLFPGVMVYVGSSAVTFTLPLRSSVPVGSSIKVKGNDSTSSTNKITIQRSGSSDLIDLETSIDLESPFAAIELIAGPSSWLVF